TTFMGGVRSGRFTDNERRYDVRVWLVEGQRYALDQMDDLYFRSDKGKLIPARDVVSHEVHATLPVITRHTHSRNIQSTADSGALRSLCVFSDRLNLTSMIGIVLLTGWVKKNSIILVDYTSLLRSEGKSPIAAVLIACPTRLRPILMTTLATIAGALPLAV